MITGIIIGIVIGVIAFKVCLFFWVLRNFP